MEGVASQERDFRYHLDGEQDMHVPEGGAEDRINRNLVAGKTNTHRCHQSCHYSSHHGIELVCCNLGAPTVELQHHEGWVEGMWGGSVVAYMALVHRVHAVKGTSQCCYIACGCPLDLNQGAVGMAGAYQAQEDA